LKAIITGVAGFFGTNLAEYLLRDSTNQVIGVDNLLSGKQSNVDKLSEHRNFKFLQADCRKLSDFDNKNFQKSDLLFHLAANSDIAAAVNNPILDFELGILTAQNMLEVARTNGVKHFIFSSGSGVYGEDPDSTFTESSLVGKPISTYGATKLAAESLLSAYTHMFDFKGTSFRFANLVGPNATHGVIFDFVSKLKRTPEYLEVLGNGTQLKPYIHIEDALVGIFTALENQNEAHEVFNVGNDDSISVAEIAQECISALGPKTCDVRFGKDPRGWKADIPKYQLSSKKLKSLGWSPKLNSREAVRRAIIECINDSAVKKST
jgi:UDP-glucose 4-epimerase